MKRKVALVDLKVASFVTDIMNKGGLKGGKLPINTVDDSEFTEESLSENTYIDICPEPIDGGG